jgi:hypothetical protein
LTLKITAMVGGGPSTMGERVIYANAMELLREQGIDPLKAKLTQSFLRLEQPMITGTNTFTFQVIQSLGAGGQTNTENRLTLQDSFVASSVGLFLFVPATATGTGTPLLSYPNPAVFTGANEATSGETLYHSQLSLTVNKEQIVPAWDTFRSRMVPQTQFITFTAAATGNQAANQDQISGRDDVFYPTEPNWVIIGSRGSVPVLTMPTTFAAVHANARLVLYLRGVLAQNSTSVN